MNEQITISALYDLNEKLVILSKNWERPCRRMNTNSGQKMSGLQRVQLFIRQRILTVRVLSAKRRRYVTAHLSAARQLSGRVLLSAIRQN